MNFRSEAEILSPQLMDRRSATTADRPESYLANLATGGLHMGISRYNDNWKVQRKAAQTILTPQATNRHLPIQRAEATQLMYDFLKTPQVSLGLPTCQRNSDSVVGLLQSHQTVFPLCDIVYQLRETFSEI